jgi:hypothetical protein
MLSVQTRTARTRHCEERSDEAIQEGVEPNPVDCFAALAMTMWFRRIDPTI